MPGTSFDRVAEIYDSSRGGEVRGRKFADAIAPWIVGDRVAELGVGTGVIAHGLRPHGIAVAGFDVSDAMMRAAVERVGPCVAVADVDHLPLADDSVDTAIFVWVLQLVDDVGDTLAEAARVVRPGGRVVAILAGPVHHPDDEIGAILDDLASLTRRGRGQDPSRDVAPAAMTIEFDGHTPWDSFSGVASEQADLVERRAFSSLFDVDDETWRATVVPVIERLRAMPDADAERERRTRHPLVVWTVRG